MRDHYRTLGLSSAASSEEIRRAYRILARRYHPDVNPGKDTDERFRAIAEAYEILSDSLKRKQYDAERDVIETFSSAFDRAHQAYRKQQASVKKPPVRPAPQPKKQTTAREEPRVVTPPPRDPPKTKPEPKVPLSPKRTLKVYRRLHDLKHTLRKSIIKAREILKTEEAPKQEPPPHIPRVNSLSLLEVSISVFDAITGLKKTVEVTDQDGASRKVSVSIPAGVRQGSVIRLRSKESESEEIIVIIKINPHPWLSISHRGLTMEIPITLDEAIAGAKIQVPSLGDPLLVTVDAGIQSGSEVRLKGQGITLPDGSRGDLFIRFMIKIPSPASPETLIEKAKELNSFYTEDIRKHITRNIIEPSEEDPQ